MSTYKHTSDGKMYRVDKDFDVELEIVDSNGWDRDIYLSEGELEEMLRSIKEAKENKRGS